MKPLRANRSRGFTLIEVMVALVVMAIMAVMAWQGVDGIVRARNVSQARLEQTLRFNTVIEQWDQDLASVQPSAVIPSPVTCDGSSVRMVRRTPDGLQIVAWTLRPSDGEGNGTWVRWAGPAVTTTSELTESWLRSQQLQGDEPGSLKTLVGVASWQVYFFWNTAWANCQSSGNSGGAGTLDSVPNGVRIVLGFGPGSGIGGDLTRDTLVHP